MLIATRIDLDEDGVTTCGIVAFDNLGDFFHCRNYLIEATCLFQKDTDERTGLVANLRWGEDELRALDDTDVDESLHPLVNCRARDAAHSRHLEECDARITHDELENLAVESVDRATPSYPLYDFCSGSNSSLDSREILFSSAITTNFYK